jgi:hypothetical protein
MTLLGVGRWIDRSSERRARLYCLLPALSTGEGRALGLERLLALDMSQNGKLNYLRSRENLLMRGVDGVPRNKPGAVAA